MTPIQGSDAVMSFYKNDFLPFICASDISVQISANKVPIKTKGDGHWQKYTYQDLGWSVTLSGLLVFDEENWTGWDFIQNQIGFTHVTVRCTFTDKNGNVRSIQGDVMIEGSTIKMSPGDVVKNDFNLTGNGVLMVFDGTIPCPTAITGIGVSGTTDPSGIATFDYEYDGPVAQVKYRIDGLGSYGYAGVGTSISTSLGVGDHSVEIIPICANGYEGQGFTQAFTMTLDMSCALEVSNITPVVTGSTVVFTINFGSDPSGSTLQYSLNGTTWTTYVGAPVDGMSIALSGLAIGSYLFYARPICANGVAGIGDDVNFDIVSSPTTSVVNYSFTAMPGGSPSFYIYVNGALVFDAFATASGSISVPVGATVLARSTVAATPRDMTLIVHDDTTSTNLYNNNINTTSSAMVTLQHTWTANGDTYTISDSITP